MYIQFSSYNSPVMAQPLTTAVAWVATLTCEFGAPSSTGGLTLSVNPDPLSANNYCVPLDVLHIHCGQAYTGVDGDGNPVSATFPSMDEIMSDNAEAFSAIKEYLYNKLMLLPQFANSATLVS